MLDVCVRHLLSLLRSAPAAHRAAAATLPRRAADAELQALVCAPSGNTAGPIAMVSGRELARRRL